eukprot:8591799-Alexandrium_andersonii.AAC.1
MAWHLERWRRQHVTLSAEEARARLARTHVRLQTQQLNSCAHVHGRARADPPAKEAHTSEQPQAQRPRPSEHSQAKLMSSESNTPNGRPRLRSATATPRH